MSSERSFTAAMSPNFLVTLRIRTKGLAAGSRQGRASAMSWGFLAMGPVVQSDVKDGALGPVPCLQLRAGLDPLPGLGEDFVVVRRVGLEREQLGRDLRRRVNRG